MDSIADFSFLCRYLKQQLNQFPTTKRYLIGFSGGMDSHLLLSAISELKLEQQIVAIHVNHLIQAESDQWQQHCAEIATDLDVEFISQTVDANPPSGESPEAWARKLRYAAFADHLEPDDILLLAQHRDDQIETFVLQLLRGSGPHGLAAMPTIRNFENGWLARPFLGLSRADLEAYAKSQKLDWIEDPSNLEMRYDRNYLRHKILPLIQQRWPSYTKSLNRAIAYQAEASQILDDSAQQDLALTHYQNSTDLSINALKKLDDKRLRNLLRFWIKEAGFSLPSMQKLRQIIDSVIEATDDRSPLVEWQGVELRRYRDRLILMQPLEEIPEAFYWDMKQPLTLSTGVLSISKKIGEGFKVPSDQVEVRFRLGGETFKPADQDHHVRLKKYLQEKAIPPWLRDRLPLIYCDGQLVAVADLCVADQFKADKTKKGVVLYWKTL